MKFSSLFLISFFISSVGLTADWPVLGDLNCGQLGQSPCSITNKEWWMNGSGGCDRGLKRRKGKCHYGKRKTLKEDETKWISRSLKFQRELLADEPFFRVPLIGGHNSFNNRRDGYLLPNQIYSATDLLNLGVRQLELDVHWYNKALRMCHGFSPQKYCSLFDRLYHNYIEEITIWLKDPKNKDEIVVLEMEPYLFGKRDALIEPLKHHLGNLILTEADFSGDLKDLTLNQIREMGKRVLIFARNNAGEYGLGHIPRHPNFQNGTPKKFNGKTCEFSSKAFDSRNKNPSKYVHLNENRLRFFVADAHFLDGAITPTVLKQALECHVTLIRMDQIKPDKLKDAIWSWDEGEPNITQNGDKCSYTQKNGRWRLTKCESIMKFACQSLENDGYWRISYSKGTFSQGEEVCKREFPGFKFGLPSTGWENARLYKNNKIHKAWLNYSHNDKQLP